MAVASRTQVVKFIRKGDKGDTGATGAVLRGPQAWSDCAVGYSFCAGSTGENWLDVVIYNSQYYVCKKSHTKTATNYPGSSTAEASGLWQLGDSINLVATKILMATYALVENLGVEVIDMRDADGNILFQAKDGNVTCKTGTFENVTIKGKLDGVTGSFKSLNCVNNDGKVVGGISFSGEGRMWFSGDMYHQGYNHDKDRSCRFYSSDIWCRGMFGAAERTVLEVYGSFGYFYPKGLSGASVRVTFETGTDSSKNTYYKIPLYAGSDVSEAAGMPVDIVCFRSQDSTKKYYDLQMYSSQRALIVNSNNNYNNVAIYAHGTPVTWNGGSVAEVAKLAEMCTPSQGTNILGRGLFVGAFRDNDW